ncbi:hypothetical protein CARUB_v10012388mg, partial [Capsella rubella]
MGSEIGQEWREEIFQKIRSMNEVYAPYVNDVYQIATDVLHCQEPLPQQQRTENVESWQSFKKMVEELRQFLSVTKSSITPAFKKKLAFHEKMLKECINMYRKMQTRQQGELPQAQTVQDQSHDNQTNLQMQSMNMHVTGPRLQQSSNVLSSCPGVSAPQQNVPISIPASSCEYSITEFLNRQSLRKTVQQGQLPKSQNQHVQQRQSQTVQDQSHDNQKNPQIQSMSMQGAGPRAQQSKQGVVQSFAIGIAGISGSPILQELTSPDGNTMNPLTSTCGKSSATEPSIERLIRAVQSISSQALSSAVSDIISVVRMGDRIAGSFPGNVSTASVGEDLVAMSLLQERNFMTQEEMIATMKRKRQITAMPLSVASLGGSFGDRYKQFAGLIASDMQSSVTCGGKKASTEAEHTLLEEIKEINQRLIDTVVEICDDEDAADHSEGAISSKGCEGTTVKFSFISVSLSPALKAHLSSTHMSPIRPLRLLVPRSYPNGSPSLLDILPVETSKENEDLSSKVMARCNILLKKMSQPMSLKDIAKTWDSCVRDVICKYAQQFGGGTFSSKYGAWEKY